MKSGITLIEVAITILLSSLLASALFMSFSQLQRTSRITESFIEVDMPSSVVMHQMSQDISGAFVPQLALIKTSTGQPAQPQATDKQARVTPLDMSTVFKVQHKNKNLDMLTCITNNPVVVYDTVKPRVARVVYRLIEDKQKEGSFRLMRQESLDLNLNFLEKTDTQKVRSYELARNIKSCTCTCMLLDYPVAQEQQQQKKESSDIVPTLRTFNDWIFDPKSAQEQKMPPLPFAVRVHCVFWDDRHEREWPLEFSVRVASFVPYGKKIPKKAEQKPTPQQNIAKPETVAVKPNSSAKVEKTTVTMQLKIPDNVAKFLAKQGSELQ